MDATDTIDSEPNRQWIFPSIRFTCSANVTAWVFRVSKNDAMPTANCPTLELWMDNVNTPSKTTDYVRENIISNYSEPQRLSDFVFHCDLITPLMVPSGTVLGFKTALSSTESVLHVQFMAQSGTVGFHRDMALGAILFDTDTALTTVQEASGIVPFIVPVYGELCFLCHHTVSSI